MATAEISKDGDTLTVRIPLTFRKRGGRKLVIAPRGSDSWEPPRPHLDTTLVKAVVRAHRWKRMLERGQFATIQDLAVAEKINPSYLSRVLGLTMLAPYIVEEILDGRQPRCLTLEALREPLPSNWSAQKRLLTAIIGNPETR